MTDLNFSSIPIKFKTPLGYLLPGFSISLLPGICFRFDSTSIMIGRETVLNRK